MIWNLHIKFRHCCKDFAYFVQYGYGIHNAREIK